MLGRWLLPILMLGAQAHPLRAQTMVEYGTVGGGVAAAAGAAATGKAVTGVFGKLNQTLAGAAKSGDASKPAPAPPAATAAVKSSAASAEPPKSKQPEPPSEPVPPPDFSALAIGMDRADLLKKIGKPSMTISSMESSVLVENCSYRKGSGTVAVTLRDGKVTAITGAEELVAK